MKFPAKKTGSLNVRIKRVDERLPLPQYETSGSVGFDLLVREDTVVEPGTLALIPNNVIVEVPAGYMLMLANRSSTPRKKGLMVANGIGVVDLDYHGPADEVKTLVYNFSHQTVTVARGEKISQGIFVRVDRAEWSEADEHLKNESRGGFGSTDGTRK